MVNERKRASEHSPLLRKAQQTIHNLRVSAPERLFVSAPVDRILPRPPGDLVGTLWGPRGDLVGTLWEESPHKVPIVPLSYPWQVLWMHPLSICEKEVSAGIYSLWKRK